MLEYVRCDGSELSLADCANSTNTVSCDHRYDFAVSCQGLCSTHGDLRLARDSRPYFGWVEVCVNGCWSTLCYEDWTIADTLVVCRQLGYFNGRHTRVDSAVIILNALIRFTLISNSC